MCDSPGLERHFPGLDVLHPALRLDHDRTSYDSHVLIMGNNVLFTSDDKADCSRIVTFTATLDLPTLSLVSFAPSVVDIEGGRVSAFSDVETAELGGVRGPILGFVLFFEDLTFTYPSCDPD